MANYLILPSLENPKYVLPIRGRELFSHSLALYTPFVLKRKLQISALKTLHAAGMLRSLFKDKVISENSLERFIPDVKIMKKQVHKFFGYHDVEFAFFLGSAGKTTVQIMSRNADIIGYLKTANGVTSKSRIMNEKGMLSRLKQFDFKFINIPEVIFFENCNDVIFLATSACDCKRAKRGTDLRKSHISALVELFMANHIMASFSRTKCYRIMSERLDKMPQEHDNLNYKKAFYWAVDKIVDHTIPFGLCHYDFKPWNIRLLRNGKLYVFDWELSRTEWLPLWDVFHYILQTNILIKKINAIKLTRKLMGINQLILLYMDALQLKNQHYLPLLLLYLIDVSCYYYKEANKHSDEQAITYLTNIKAIIEYLMKEYK